MLLFFMLLIDAGKVFDVYSKNYRVERSEKNYQYKKYLGLIGKDSEKVVRLPKVQTMYFFVDYLE